MWRAYENILKGNLCVERGAGSEISRPSSCPPGLFYHYLCVTIVPANCRLEVILHDKLVFVGLLEEPRMSIFVLQYNQRGMI